ncbi:MAG TPA: pyridine nucleotide-disulfide oxidoreductase, partial [Lentisphaeria bacterium]|nr:pyridine nucleotide-disulfide oxidoreductase [Lentisphaeria bacterium]
ATNVGVRETRHFKGLYTMNETDIVEAKVFDDWIATRNFFNFDIHNIEGAGLDANGAQHKFKARGDYTIPYRCCVPEKIDGLLLSGRNISGTHKAHSNFRVMSICLNIGHGTGVAAALAAKKNIQPRKVDAREVQEILKKQGMLV